MVDWTAILTNVPSVLISVGLVAWVYKVLNNRNLDLKEQMREDKAEFKESIAKLEAKLSTSDAKANKWFRRYFLIANIIENNSCRPDCRIKEEYNKFNEKHGEV